MRRRHAQHADAAGAWEPWAARCPAPRSRIARRRRGAACAARACSRATTATTAPPREILDGDWLLTGDLGALDADGFLRITGRKKDLIITSSGKNITPANIEAALRESRWISQAVVHGDNRPYLVALLTLDPEEAPALAEQLGIAAGPPAMAGDERVRAALQAEVDAVNEQFARIEQIKSFVVLDHDLTQAAGELTPTLKVKRNVVEDHYGAQLEALYA